MLLYPPLRKLPTLSLSVLLWATLVFEVIVPVVNGQDSDIDKHIQEVFPTPPVTPSTSNDKCSCVPFYRCNNSTINTDGTGLIDIRFNSGPCDNYLEKCCNDPLTNNQIPESKNPKTFNCGQWNSGGVGFRITGNYQSEAQFGEFPWMVAILKQDTIENKNAYLCGASLIHPQVVMTAVHCIYDKTPGELIIRAGEWDTQTENELFPFQDGRVSKIVKHENYYGGAVHNDVALIFLTEPFHLTDNVATVCLPPRDFQFNREKCYVSGWGKDVFGKDGVHQVILKRIDLNMVPDDVCQDQLRQTRLGSRFQLHESFICAGGEVGKDACKGDGGSPLVCPTPEHSEQFHQSGIVAWGIGCGEKTPGVYVDVSHFRLWIDQQMINHGYDTTYYDAYYTPPMTN